MACDITAGRLEGCKDSVGGLNAIYFINYGATEGFVATDETITGTTATLTTPAFKYDLKGTSTFDQSLTSSRDNGSTFWCRNECYNKYRSFFRRQKRI